ncbi:MAG: insulinase family protein [Victivallales bacterium]|nr:insulinase family protein [Victivallales bacterium]
MPSKRVSSLPDLGTISTLTLDNGICIYVRENHLSPMAIVQAWVRTGSIHEGEHLGCGLSHFLEHMVFQGSANFSGTQIMDLIHRNGGEMNAYTSFACTVYYADILSYAVHKAIAIISDIVFSPVFPEAAFKTEKDVILRERAMVRDNPDRVLGEKLWQTVFGQHPVRHPIIGYEDKIRSVNRKIMSTFHDSRYTPGRVFFVVCGDVKTDDVFEQISKICSGIPRGSLNDPVVPDEPPQSSRRECVSYFTDPLSRISLAFRIPQASHEDTPGLNILSSILSEGKSSRLVSRIRDQSRLAVHIDSFCYNSLFDGIFAVTAACRPRDLQKLEKAISREILLAAESISPEELRRVKKNIVTRTFRHMRTNDAVASMIGGSVLNYGSHEYACKYLQDIARVDTAAIKDIARKYLRKDASSSVRILPREPRSAKKPCASNKALKLECDAKPIRHVFENGLRMIYMENRSLPLVDITVVMPGGSFYEPPGKAGCSSLIASLVLAGTKSFPEHKLSRTLDNSAIICNLSSGANTLMLRMNFPKSSINMAFKALKSLLSEPLFRHDKFIREQGMAIETLKSRSLIPQKAAHDVFSKAIFGDHPYSIPACGTLESVEALTPEDVADFYFNSCLDPSRFIVGIVGDIDSESARWLASGLAKSVPWKKNIPKKTPALPQFPRSPVAIDFQIPREQSVVMLGVPGCSNTSQDRFAIDFLQTALNGLETRLFKSIRNKAGLAYYTGMSTSRGIHPGYIAFYAGTSPAGAEKVVSIMKVEKDRLVKHGLNKNEFTMTLARLKGYIADQKMNIAEEMTAASLSEFYGNGYLEQWCLWDIYSGMSLAEANKTIRKYLACKNTVTIVASGSDGT